MGSVEEVRQLDDTHLHWRVEHDGHEAEFDAEITERMLEVSRHLSPSRSAALDRVAQRVCGANGQP